MTLPIHFRVLSLLLILRLDLVKSLVSLVTGANGYVGRAVVHELLESSDEASEIICLVRQHRVVSEQNYWKEHLSESSSSKIQVLPYDMLDGGESLRNALQSCRRSEEEQRCVFHIASVFGPTDDHEQTALGNVRGTEDLVHELAKEGGPFKLVLTSSMAAVRGSGQEPSNGKFYTHHDWNTVSQLGANWGASYQWSKMQSERRGRDLCDKYSIPLVVFNPSFVFGPASFAEATSSYSLTLVGQWARGESPVQSRLYVDIRDVARAHVAAAISTGADGKRYILSTEARVPSQEIAGWLKDVCKHTGLANPDSIHYDGDFDGGAIPVGEREVESTDRLREELGLRLRPVKETIIDMAKVLLEEKAKV